MMPDVLLGVFLGLLLFYAKRTLVLLIISKKLVALRIVIIVLSELLMFLGLYLFIIHYKRDIVNLLIGFAFVLVTSIIFYVINSVIKTKRE